MTTPNNTINDASVLGGSIPITIGSTVYDTEDFQMDPQVMEYARSNSQGIVNGRRTQLTEWKGSATIVFPSVSDNGAVVIFGAAFTTAIQGVSYTCAVTSVSPRYVFNGQAKMQIKFNVNIGTVALSAN